MSISVPLPYFQYHTIEFYFIYSDTSITPSKITFKMPATATIKDVFTEVGKNIEIEEDEIELCYINDHKIKETFKL